MIGRKLHKAIPSYRLNAITPPPGQFNELLERDAKLAAYDYHFRVLSLENGVAALSSPRSPEMPAVRFLSILQPRLAGKPADDPAVVSAEKELAEHQARAKKLILAQPDVTQVRWVLDQGWYAERGIALP